MRFFVGTVRKLYNFEKLVLKTVEFLFGRFKKTRTYILINAWFKTHLRGCSIKCVKVRKVIINNFDHGKERNEEKREAITIE